MSIEPSVYDEMKKFLQFGDEDIANLKALAPVFEKHGGAITDRFYSTLQDFPVTAKMIEGRVESLKKTHGRWMNELFAGDYGQAYFDSRVVIGEVHVKIGLPPYYVEGVMNNIRTSGQLAISTEMPDRAGELITSFLKILDLDLILINLAYADERLARVSKMTGMSRKLIENMINKPNKKK